MHGQQNIKKVCTAINFLLAYLAVRSLSTTQNGNAMNK